ncbi:nucleotide kinase domain-containing protein [Burkholderia gladioli]|uniref:nucleotide kinase domain-containing protein n=1 Tax=Burkholderia gladioli TaxID=28095 RepID=UPI00163E7843|nr:nucleotide kinase domain-containing protein [Burkholderia gladioli]
MKVGAKKSCTASQNPPVNETSSTTAWSHLLPIEVTPVFDTYWRFAVERQNVFFRRLEGRSAPWTEDPVISIHKFTNAYRASDRVSQYLIRHVIYRNDLPQSPSEVLFRTLLFKLFNKIETWELLEHSLGEITFKNYRFEHYDKVLSQAMKVGGRIYSAAYIMPPGGSAFGHTAKHQNHLRLLERMMADDLAGQLTQLKKMQTAFELLRGYPTIGDFLAYQFVTDINYSEVTDFSEMDFVIPGPGARDGLRKCFRVNADLNEAELIRLMVDNQEREFERLGIKFQSLWGRRLQLIDCQNLFCEVDKYARVAHPDVAGISGRTRIKQKFSPTGPLSLPWYPPKWGINSKIEAEFSQRADTLHVEKTPNKSTTQSTLELGG